MKAEIDKLGVLTITAEDIIEIYALSTWRKTVIGDVVNTSEILKIDIDSQFLAENFGDLKDRLSGKND